MAVNESAIIGCLLGGAVGDALGLPYEGLSRSRAERMLGPPSKYHFLFGRGMCSDDTEHACLVAQACIASDDAIQFERSLSRSFRWWFAGLPAGVGMATAKACLKLWIGLRPPKSGIYSAGNGPAMRSAILGAAIDTPQELRTLVHSSSRITHRDPKALAGAYAVAAATRLSRGSQVITPELFRKEFAMIGDVPCDELIDLLEKASQSVAEGESTQQFCRSMGWPQRVSGYTLHTVPVCIHAWLSHPDDFAKSVTAVIRCGGDADTTAAIVGGIVGARVGKNGIPRDWLCQMIDWPRTVEWIESLGKQLSRRRLTGTTEKPIRLTRSVLLARNLVFLAVVLTHGFRRLAPPY